MGKIQGTTTNSNIYNGYVTVDCRSLAVSEWPLFKVIQSFTGNRCLSQIGRQLPVITA